MSFTLTQHAIQTATNTSRAAAWRIIRTPFMLDNEDRKGRRYYRLSDVVKRFKQSPLWRDEHGKRLKAADALFRQENGLSPAR